MRILITNNSLAVRAGTELVVYEIARAMQARGHEVAAYSSNLGEVAELLTASAIPVISHPETCPFKPDIIHAQHHLDAMTALLAFPDSPAVFHSHGGIPWLERPPAHPRIVHYIAMCEDLATTNRHALGLTPDQISALPNWVDLGRFRGMRTPEARPARALLFGGGLGGPEMVNRLRPAFAQQGIPLDSLSDWTDTDRRTPELALPRYDIVLASGRSAIEAMASGCAVIIANHQCCIGWARPENFATLRRQNFAPKRIDPAFDVFTIQACLAGYDAAAALETSRLVREQCRLPQAMDRLAAIHQSAADAWSQIRPRTSESVMARLHEEQRAELAYFRQLATAVRDVEAMHVSSRAMQRQLDRADKEREKLAMEVQKLEGKLKHHCTELQLMKRLHGHWLGKLALSWCRKSAARPADPQHA